MNRERVMRDALVRISEVGCTAKHIDPEVDRANGAEYPAIDWHDIEGDDGDGEASFKPDACPVCIARRALEKVGHRRGPQTLLRHMAEQQRKET